ncbi:Uncharacterised protein [Vibrio cholerae]|nr:Uncharacterised protein [Vibrio cholerae]
MSCIPRTRLGMVALNIESACNTRPTTKATPSA